MMRNRKTSRRQIAGRRGDTLIEVIFSLAILSSLMVIALSGALLAWRTSLDAAYRSQATYIAQRQAEALQAYEGSISWSQFTDATPAGLGIGQYVNTAACGGGSGISCTTGTATQQFSMTITSPTCDTDDDGNWSPVSGNQTETLSTASTAGLACPTGFTQNTLSSTYTTVIYVHLVAGPAATPTQLRFDIAVTWPSLIRHNASTAPNIVNEVIYLNQPST